jgi:hypothetical protein
MFDVIMGVVAGILTVLLAELRRRRKISVAPPPTTDACKNCFFFHEYRRLVRSQESDTKVLRLRFQNEEKGPKRAE